MTWKVCLIPLLVLTAKSLAFPESRTVDQSEESDPDVYTSSSEENMSSGKDYIQYNAEELPRNASNGDERLNIEVNLYIRDIEEIDNFKQDVKLQITFRQKWKDHRLKFDEPDSKNYVTLTNPHRIWTPDTFIGNERHGYFHDLLKPNVLIRVYPNGEVLYSTRVTVVVKCVMDFHKYPFDRQECSTVFASYGYTTSEIAYSWRTEEPVTVSKNRDIPPFELDRYYTDKCGPVQTQTGSYDCLRVSLIFKRNAASILVKTYFPAAVFVVLSWLSFWMAPKFVSGRCLVLVTSLVSTTLLYYFMVDSLPPVNYTRSMDIYMWTCVAFIFASILEFMMVVSFSRKQEENQNTKVEPFTIPNAERKEKKRIILNVKDYLASQSPGAWATILDKTSRGIFPLAFAVFVAIYFVQVKRGFEDGE